MAWRTNRVNALRVIDIPDDIPEGAVIGVGGCQSKLIQSKHGVGCRVKRGSRKVFVEGSREGVENAAREIYELFNQKRAERERQSVLSNEMHPTPSTIHTMAVAKHSAHSGWCFELRGGEGTDDDPNVKDFPNRLLELPVENGVGDDDKDEDDPLGWVSTFDPSFRRRMADQVSSITTEDGATIKLKAAFGLQCFALPDTSLGGGRVFSWEELKALKLHAQVKLRWSNMVNLKSDVSAKLLDDLEGRFEAATAFKTELVVYVNKRNGNRGDISIKYRWEYGEWVLVDRKPVRLAHALYNVALDNETAFRVRVYSRQQGPPSLGYTELVDGLNIAVASERDPFSTTVTTQPGFPSGLFLRSFAVRERASVEAHGLRFTISYMDAKRKTATMACRLLDSDVKPVEAIEQLVDKLLARVTHP